MESEPGSRSVPRVVIAGGGIASLEAVLALRAIAGESVAVEVRTPDQEFVYGALSVAVPFLGGEVRRFPLDRLVALAGGVVQPGRAVSVDPRRHVLVTDAGEVGYDALLLALGARAETSLAGALTFRGPADAEALATLLHTVATGPPCNLVFVLPAAPTRHLPLYELALETQSYLGDRGAEEVSLTIVTPESSPLALFGPEAGTDLRDFLAERGIHLVTAGEVMSFAGGELHLKGKPSLPADHVVAMAQLQGPHLPGIPCDADGFVAVDEHGRVAGLDDVYAAGDMTSFPIKHGGIATQQADAAAEAIAAAIGVAIEPRPFHPVLRSQLLTGMFPRYLRLDAAEPDRTFSTQAPWWPVTKVVGRYLTPFLSKHLGLAPIAAPVGAGGAEREVELQPDGSWTAI